MGSLDTLSNFNFANLISCTKNKIYFLQIYHMYHVNV